jgi:hypothetical protein
MSWWKKNDRRWSSELTTQIEIAAFDLLGVENIEPNLATLKLWKDKFEGSLPYAGQYHGIKCGREHLNWLMCWARTSDKVLPHVDIEIMMGYLCYLRYYELHPQEFEMRGV